MSFVLVFVVVVVFDLSSCFAASKVDTENHCSLRRRRRCRRRLLVLSFKTLSLAKRRDTLALSAFLRRRRRRPCRR